MKQTFIRTILGHSLEFTRLSYPIKYAIISEDVIYSGFVIVAQKEETGGWAINTMDKVPGWVTDITPHLVRIIEENENGLSNKKRLG